MQNEKYWVLDFQTVPARHFDYYVRLPSKWSEGYGFEFVSILLVGHCD